MDDNLATIQRLQFTNRAQAEQLLQRWFALHMNLHVESVRLTPRAVSLNSFNGFYRSAGQEYFFKTHVEEQGVLQEYYHAELLYQAGYNIVRPLRTLHEEGRQMVIYPVVTWPVVFDLMRAIETGDTANTGNATLETLASAEQQECNHLLAIYHSTFAPSTDTEHAPIHQLFWHRLTGGRFKSFYEGKNVPLPGIEDAHVPFNELLQCHWVINGIAYPHTLGELVERAKTVLHPSRPLATIIGHGDAHFGNVFLEDTHRYLYFDPAFAGRHSPLLDVIKPLFHNVFATWMYFPQEIARDLQLSVSLHHTTIFIEHNYTPTPIRQAILHTKIDYLLKPLIADLGTHDALPEDWQEIMRLALLCCPLLTINLLDETRQPRFPVEVSWLGLVQAVEVGNSGIQPWGFEA